MAGEETGVDRARIAEALRRIVGPEGLVESAEGRLVYECDALAWVKGRPDFVVLPRSTPEVAGVARLCWDEGLALTPRGSGTGLSGGAMPARGGVVIGLNRMDRILEVDLASRLAVVEAGLINLALSRALQPHGFHFAPDPSSQFVSSIGGNVAENAGGAHCLKYGVTANHVLGLTLVLADGTVVPVGGRARDVPGYDLPGVFTGSEGTLGLATEVIVRLTPNAEAVRTLLAVFRSLEAAGEAVSAIIARGIIPAALEMIDRHVIRAVEDGIGAGYPRDAEAVLLIELDGPRAEVEAEAVEVEAACRAAEALDLRVARSEAERLLLWRGRKEAAGAMGRLTPEYYLHDVTVPRSKLPRLLREIDAIGARHGVLIANVFHAGDGNLHPLVGFDSRRPGDMARALDAGTEILKACVAAGGCLSGEHGIGCEKSGFMTLIYDEADLAAMKRVRAAFDPRGLCNPDKIFPAPGARVGFDFAEELLAAAGRR
jgi:glycolate oxidase